MTYTISFHDSKMKNFFMKNAILSDAVTEESKTAVVLTVTKEEVGALDKELFGIYQIA